MKGRLLSAIALTAALGACGTVATRDIPLEALPEISGIKSSRSAVWYVEDVRVSVPQSLRVSEENLYLPDADIVWREDPFGDRREQVRVIVDMGASQAVLGLDGKEPVYLDIEVKRFHALTQKARATTGGHHAVTLEVTIRDVDTDVVIVDPFEVAFRLPAYGGRKAIQAEMRGETQKVRIIREINSVMRSKLGI